LCAALAGIPAPTSVKSVVPVSKTLFMAILLHRFITIHSFGRFREQDGCATRDRRQP
jgi:hypothetical protein